MSRRSRVSQPRHRLRGIRRSPPPPGVIPIADAATIQVVLSHVPPDGRVTITIPGRTLYSGPIGEHQTLEVQRARFPEAPVVLSVRAYDPEMPKRTLYSASARVCAPPRDDAENTGAVTRIVFGLDGVAWWTGPEDDAPDLWDQIGRPTTAFSDTPADPTVTATCRLDADDPPGAIVAGTRDLHVTVTVANNADRPIRVFAIDLSSDDYLVFPTSARPAAIAPGESADQSFRLDTLSDTPTGNLPVTPRVAFVYEGDDLLTDGDFETATVAAEGEPGWLATETATLSALASGDGAMATFAARMADWRSYDEVTFSNPVGVGVAGEAYAALKLSEKPAATLPVLTQTCELPGASAYSLGCASWGGEEGCLELLDAEGNPLAGVKRNFAGHWWRDSVYNWIERTLRLPMAEDAVSARVSLFARSASTRWDACYLAPTDAVRVATAADLTLDVQAVEIEGGVVYLGEDRDTQGDWIGTYGSHCWILCAMSAPRDMVGGMVAPIKCKDASLTKTYRNETIWVRGEGEFRYASWTTNPKDAKTRHWIGAMRTQDRRALENPQWGERTYASWDDHGELHPTDGWGPDMPIKLRMPEGLWKLSLYFADWDWHDAPFPRDQRIEVSLGEGDTVCSARVSRFGGGAYVVFGVEGGRDLDLRVRKDRSAAMLVSGIFLDALAEPQLHRGSAKLPEELLSRLAELDADDATACLSAHRDLPALVADLDAACEADAAANDPATQRLRGEVWARVAGGHEGQERAFEGYAQALVATLDAERAGEHLQKEADEYFEANDLGPAERRYDAALRLLAAGRTPTERADAHKRVAVEFRIVHPLYAQRHIADCISALGGIDEDERVAYLRALADELRAMATRDHKQGRGLVRLPYVLSEFTYRRLTDLVGYDGLTADERMGLMESVRGQMWYTLGWNRTAQEQERLLASLDEQGEDYLPLLIDMLRTYSVLAQRDASYIEKAAALIAEAERVKAPDPQLAKALSTMLQIYYHENKWDEGRKLCERLKQMGEEDTAERYLKLMKED